MDQELMTMWLSVDPLADKYPGISPYAYCAWNPIRLVDPDGNDWYETTNGEVKWTDCKNQKEMNDNGVDRRYCQGAITADVTVYGPNGDITSMTGFTMTSDYHKYGAIAEGLYDANYDSKGKSGSLKSHWTLNNRGAVPTLDNLPNMSPYAGPNAGIPQMTGIFIHSTNANGYAGGNVSVGCLLLAPNDFKKFNSIMSGVQNFTVRVTRTQQERIPLMGITGPVPNMQTIKTTIRR